MYLDGLNLQIIITKHFVHTKKPLKLFKEKKSKANKKDQKKLASND